MITRVLFVDSDAEALARIKAAVESAGNYEAKVFVTGQAALEYAQQNPPTVAVISLNIADVTPAALAQTLRSIQPGLPIVLRAPADTDQQIIDSLNPQGVLEGSYTSRVLIPMVEDLLLDADPDPTEPLPPLDPETAPELPPTLPEEAPGEAAPAQPQSHPDDDLTAFGEVLKSIDPAQSRRKEDTFKALVDQLSSEPPARPNLPQRRQMQNWAEEEPPEVDASQQLFEQLAEEEPPMPGLEDSGTVRDLIAITDPTFSGEAVETWEVPDELVGTPESTELDDEARGLLSALAELSVPPQPASQPAADAGAALPGEDALIPMPDDIRNQIESGAPVLDSDTPTDPETPHPETDSARLEPPQPKPLPETTPQPVGQIDSAAAALALTQKTLETAAQAALLLRADGSVIAFAGALPETDIYTLAGIIDCEAVLASNGPRIKYIALPQTLINYMVVSAPTVDDMVLAMVYPESMQLRLIREQAQAMLNALASSAAAEAAPPPTEAEQEAPAPNIKAEETGSRPAVGSPLRETPLPQTPEEDAEDTEQLPDLDLETPAPDPSEAFLPVKAEPDETRQGHTELLESEGEHIAPLPDEATEGQGEQAESREAPETPPVLDPATLVKYACLWLLRDPEAELDDELVRALPAWVNQIIDEKHWLAEQVEAQPDYISVVVSVQSGDLPGDVIKTLMATTAQRITAARPDAAASPDDLWADAYYVVVPGRPLSHEEISRFINQQRGA